VGIILGLKEFDLGIVTKFGEVAGHHLVESSCFRSNLFIHGGSQFGKALIPAMGNPFRIEDFIGLLVELMASGVDPVNDGLLGPEVYHVFTGLIRDARSGVSLDLGALGVHPHADPVVKGVRGHSNCVRRKFCGGVSNDLYDVINQEASLADTPFINVAVNARKDLVKEGLPEGPGVDGVVS
jgi:hypothetical protein